MASRFPHLTDIRPLFPPIRSTESGEMTNRIDSQFRSGPSDDDYSRHAAMRNFAEAHFRLRRSDAREFHNFFIYSFSNKYSR